jgi:tRNA(Ile)-lysidine synthase
MDTRLKNNMQHLTWQVLTSVVERLTHKKRFLIAYSGGLDSQVLLHLLADWAKHDSTVRLRAIHIDHGLSPNASQWVSFCKATAKRYCIPFLTQEIRLQQSSKEGIEAQARRLRYDAIGQHILEDEVLLTAHHQNDQVETMILQWLRGAGPKGLAAMPAVQSFFDTQLIRPLLYFPKQALGDFARRYHLKWVVDESNELLQFKRNYVRKKIMPPLLAARLGSLNNLARTADHCAEAVQLLTELADMDLQSIEHDQNFLDIKRLLMLNLARQRNVLRRWLTLANLPVPTTAQMHVLQHEVLTATKDAQPVMCLGDITLRRYQSRLYIVPTNASFDLTSEWSWNMETVFNLPQRLGTLIAKETMVGGGIAVQKLSNQNVTIRFRQGGEYMHPSMRNHATSLKHLFQEWQIPPWQRDRWPLLFIGERLIAVVNKDVDRDFVANENEKGLQVIWQSIKTKGK